MKSVFSLIPEQASSIAPQVDLLYFFIVAVSVVFTVLAGVMVVGFAIRYRRRSEDEVPEPSHDGYTLEITGSIFLLIILMIMFGWGARLYFKGYSPPGDAVEILVTGKQWLWKVQHPQGKREINALHVPIDTPIKLTMTSEDVIHSFFVPAFRVKQDVVPGRYTYLWFTPTKLGSYHLFCTEYCGTQHSQMRGTVYVMALREYEEWLAGSVSAVALGDETSPAQLGEGVFGQLGCMACHNAGTTALGPGLDNIMGQTHVMTDGTEVVVDDNYLRESILNAQAKILKGYQPLMPVFKGMVNEEQIAQLIAYIKSLSKPAEAGQ